MTSIPDKTLIDLDWDALREALARRCHTSRGEAAALALEFLADIDEARTRCARIAELRAMHAATEPPPFGGIRDVDHLVARASKGGGLEPVDLIEVAQSIAGCGRLRRHLMARAAPAPRLAELAEPMADLSGDVAGPILAAFDDDGELADHASERLGTLRRKAQRLHENIIERAKQLMDDPRVARELQDRYYTQRDDRYVIPIRSDAPSRIRGIVHGTSQSGHTLFVEPDALVEPNNKLTIARADIVDEERRILAELTGYVREDAAAIRAVLGVAEQLDVLDGAARLADAMAASEPVLAHGGPLDLERARHPLMALSERACVPNDIALADRTILVVSGPNAGGKTVSLKTAGLAALMARAGLHIAADDGSRVPWLRAVHTDIGDDQSLERNLSTFSAHVLHLREMLADADANALVLIDEVAVGTAPEQGAALAQAVLEALAARGARAMVTTHYERVKTMAAAGGQFASAAVGFDMEALEPTFVLTTGAPGASGGLVVARKLGLDSDVVSRADALLGEERAGIEELLAAAQEDRRRAADALEAANRATAEATAARNEATASRNAAKAREKELRKSAHTDAVAALRAARDELDRFSTRLKRKRTGDVSGARDQLSKLARDVAAEAPVRDAPVGEPPAIDQLVAGAKVAVPSLGASGTVVTAPERGRVTLQVGTMRTTVAVADVRMAARGAPKPIRTPQAPTPRAGRGRRFEHQETTDDKAPARTRDNTVDLRGERVDDAITRIDRFVDDCLLAERDIVFVIHGHGTGALRKAVRQQAAQHPGVARWRGGELEEGGDGVTVLWLDVV